MAGIPDIRLAGIGAASVAGGYLAALFIPLPLIVRTICGVVAAVVPVALAFFALPPWRESERRKRIAVGLMMFEALCFAFVGTIVKLMVR